MIKINLLAEGKRPAAVRRARPAAAATRDWGPWVLLVGLLVGAAAFGGWWWLLDRERGANAADIRDSEAEVKRLEEIIKEVEDFKRDQAELERKIAVIRQLQANQRGPVQIMDAISRALPELLWLDKMAVKGNRVTLNGRAFNTNAVANFIENLGKVPEFQEPSLGDVQLRKAVYAFTITFNFTFSKPEAPAAGATAGGAAPAPGATGAAAPSPTAG